MNNSIILLGLSLITMASCALKKPDKTVSSAEQTPSKVLLEVENNVITQPIYNGSETRYNELIHSLLRVRFNWEMQQLYGESELTLRPLFL